MGCGASSKHQHSQSGLIPKRDPHSAHTTSVHGGHDGKHAKKADPSETCGFSPVVPPADSEAHGSRRRAKENAGKDKGHDKSHEATGGSHGLHSRDPSDKDKVSQSSSGGGGGKPKKVTCMEEEVSADGVDCSDASSGTPSSPDSEMNGDGEMNPANNPFGTFERPDERRRSQLLPNQVTCDQQKEAAEDFLFSDFTVDTEEIKTIKARKAENKFRGGPAVRGMKSKGDDSTFQFSDFAINVVSDLEEEIVRAHLEKKKIAGAKLKMEEEEAMFQFGDFQITKQERDATRRNADVRRTIRNYTLTALIGHSTRVKTICLIPNEKSFVSCSNMDTDLGMYDLGTGREIVSFVGHESTVTGASFSCNSKFIATTSTDYNMMLWDVVTGKQVFVFEHAKIVICSCFSNDGKYLVSGSQDKICRVWDTRKGRLIRTYSGHTGIIISLTYAPNADHVASASSDKSLRLWNATTGVQVHQLTGHTGIVLSCQYAFDGLRLVSNDEHVVRVWNTQTGSAITKLPVDSISSMHPAPPSSRKFTWTLSSYCPGQCQPLGYYVVAACSDRTIRIFQSTTGKELLHFYCKAAVYCLSSGTKEKMVFGDSYGNVYVVHLH